MFFLMIFFLKNYPTKINFYKDITQNYVNFFNKFKIINYQNDPFGDALSYVINGEHSKNLQSANHDFYIDNLYNEEIQKYFVESNKI